jgi:cytochrome c556
MVLRRPASVALLVVLVFGRTAAAHDAHDPRHRAMEGMGAHMKALRKAAEGEDPLGPGALRHAEALKQGAHDLPSLFPASSRGREGSRETPAIWVDWSGFSAAASDLEKAADQVAAAAASGDKARLAAALKRAGGECAACHNRYRAPK